MERWWTTKYKLPWSHKLFQESTFFDLLVDYFQDYYDQHPLEQYRNIDGSITFKNTGDNLVDKWEAELAQGGVPDLTEAFGKEQFDVIIKKLERARGKNPLHHMLGNT